MLTTIKIKNFKGIIYNFHGIDALYTKIGVLAPAMSHIVPDRESLRT